MIEKKYCGKDLIGKKCRPVRNICNGAGQGITPETICTIVSVVRGHGFIVQTEKCPCCGQYARISRINRNDLELIEWDGCRRRQRAAGNDLSKKRYPKGRFE